MATWQGFIKSFCLYFAMYRIIQLIKPQSVLFCIFSFLYCNMSVNLNTTLRWSWSWSHGSWIYNYLVNQCLSLLKIVWILFIQRSTRYTIMWSKFV